MDQFKLNRLNNDVMRELDNIIKELKDPRVNAVKEKGLLSIVRVSVTNDLSFADVFISSMAGFDQAKEAVKGLKNASGFIRRELAHRVKMRKAPELRFIADDSIAISAHINSMIKDLTDSDNSVGSEDSKDEE